MNVKLKPLVFAIVGIAFGTTEGYAGCVGGIGSANLSCTTTTNSSSQITLDNYSDWISTTYLPAAIQSAMSSFAGIYKSDSTAKSGWAQIHDDWGTKSASSTMRIQYYKSADPWSVSLGTVTQNKSNSQFTIDSTSNSNAANVWFEINWTGVVPTVINGVTNYIASYDYKISAAAWGSTLINGSTVWPTGGNFSSSSSGTYNFTAAVPGPTVGAGLPALLGLLGFAAWRRRQQVA